MEIKQISAGVVASPQVPMQGLSAAPPPQPQPQTVSAPPETTAQPTHAELKQAVETANRALQAKVNSELQFAMEPETGISVIKLIERESGKAIMQFPSEEILQIAKSIDRLTGSLIRRVA